MNHYIHTCGRRIEETRPQQGSIVYVDNIPPNLSCRHHTPLAVQKHIWTLEEAPNILIIGPTESRGSLQKHFSTSRLSASNKRGVVGSSFSEFNSFSNAAALLKLSRHSTLNLSKQNLKHLIAVGPGTGHNPVPGFAYVDALTLLQVPRPKLSFLTQSNKRYQSIIVSEDSEFISILKRRADRNNKCPILYCKN
uniref:Ribosomal protein S2 n=1 Tax=Romanomermis culicivorax TaxID=13658 RepID=A0A915K218_ROMCU